MVLSDWLTVLVVGWFVVITPGANMAMVIRNSVVHSRQAGIATAAGSAVGNIVHIGYCLVGIGVLISQSVLLFNTVKLVGAAYLIYLGIKALRAHPQSHALAPHTPPYLGQFAALRTGLWAALLNPKATVFFLALFTQIIRPGTAVPAQLVYGLTIVGLEFVCFALLATIVGQRTIRQRVQAVSHWIERITGVVLILLGLRVAFTGSAR